MAKFKKWPIEIDAIEVAEAVRCAERDWPAMPDWLRAAYETGDVLFVSQGVSIRTLEGVMVGARGDWIIRGVKGELYPCKGDIFAVTYEPVAAASDG